jgi:hypothetical protein
VISHHPLAPVNQLDRVPLRRPRFTNSEALILNTLINANGDVVTTRKLSLMIGVMEVSVKAYIGSLRSKLGEPKWAPRMIMTDWPCEENDYQTGYYFKEQ